MIHNTQSAQILQKQECVIIKTICPSGYHHNGFVATHALGHMMYSVTASLNTYFLIKYVLTEGLFQLTYFMSTS